MTTEFYERVPKDMRKNLEFRQRLREKAAKDALFRKQLLKMCEADTLFFFNAFAWVIEPRDKNPIIPFITWPQQDDFVLTVEDHLERGQDLWVEKSRAEGFTWNMAWLALKHWRFRFMAQIGLASKDKETADTPDDVGSLFGKIDWMLKGKIGAAAGYVLPRWMFPVESWTRRVNDSILINHEMNSMIRAYAATDDMASGGRLWLCVMDEFAKFYANSEAAMASTQYVTNCRVFGSTYKGRFGTFYEQANNSVNKKFIFDWKKNPTRNEGLYRVLNGEVVMDPENPVTQELLDKYPGTVLGVGCTMLDVLKALKKKGFNTEGTTRSPWYDKECLRASSTMSIAEELDRSPQGAEEDYIPKTVLEQLTSGEHATVCDPFYVGKFMVDPETLEGTFVADETGDLRLWCPLAAWEDGSLHPPMDRDYTIGVDLSYGKGASNSSIFVLDAKTGEQVADYTSNVIAPDVFAKIAMALGKWFRGQHPSGAYLAWETNGACGGTFTEMVREFEYGNVYRRKVSQIMGLKVTEKIGWQSMRDDKSQLLGGVDGGGLMLALIERQVKIRCAECLKECGEYVILGGKVVHFRAKNTLRESAKDEAHGDRVIAAALAVHLWKDRWHGKPPPEPISGPAEPEYGSFAWRQRERERLKNNEDTEAFCW